MRYVSFSNFKTSINLFINLSKQTWKTLLTSKYVEIVLKGKFSDEKAQELIH